MNSSSSSHPSPPPPPPPPMDSSAATPTTTPPSLLRTKATSRLAFEDHHDIITTTITATPPSRRKSTFSPSPLHLSVDKHSPIPLQDLLLSPSPNRKTKSRSIAEECLEPLAAMASRRRSKSANLMGCASPRNAPRRARRRLEKEIVVGKEERESIGLEGDLGKPRKRKQGGKSKTAGKEMLCSSLPSSSPLPKPKIADIDGQSSLDGLWELLWELIMWKNAPKSTLWFGFGSLFFLSSCFSRDVSFSFISLISHLGLLIMAWAFFYDSFPQRQPKKLRRSFELKEEDILRATRVILPIANAALEKTRNVFSGEPLMTLRLAPILLLGSNYGHLITLWRLLAAGFFMSFTIPKLYCSYSQQIQRGVDNAQKCVWDSWSSCSHKRAVAASAAMVLWNLFNVKIRIFAAFISLVILRHHHTRHTEVVNSADGEHREGAGRTSYCVIEE